MTVQNTIVKNKYLGNGSTKVFPYTFALNPEDGDFVKVFVTNAAGVESETTDFAIDTEARTVTYPVRATEPLPNGCVIVLMRNLPITQELNLENQGPFFADDIEAEMDRIVMQVQQISETVERCVKAAPTSELRLDAVVIEELYQGRDDAVAAAAAAATSETAAKASAAAAAVSVTQSDDYATAAAASAVAAANSQMAADAAAAEAERQKTYAAANADSALNAMNQARRHAENSADSAAGAATAKEGAQYWANLANDYVEPLRRYLVGGMFELDENADLMPAANPLEAASTMWEVDETGDIMPV